jgi:hypothetical protein
VCGAEGAHAARRRAQVVAAATALAVKFARKIQAAVSKRKIRRVDLRRYVRARACVQRVGASCLSVERGVFATGASIRVAFCCG